MKDIIYLSYSAALDASRGAGYESSLLCDVVFAKTRLFIDRLRSSRELDLEAARSLILLAIIRVTPSSVIKVLDFGGACGAHFWIASTVLPEQRLEWRVVETAAMVSRGRLLSGDSLKFYDSIDAACDDSWKPDVIFASSSVQYSPDVEAAIFSLFQIGARQVFLTRTPWSDLDYPIFLIQQSALSANGPGSLPPEFADQIVTYPITYFPWRRLLNIASSIGYREDFTILEARPTIAVASSPIDTVKTACFSLQQNSRAASCGYR